MASAEKSDKCKPQWMHTLPKASNTSFVFVRETGEAHTLKDARNEALNNVLQDAGFESGVSVETNMSSKDEEHISYLNDNKTYKLESDFVVNSTIKGKPVELQGVKVDEYWERDKNGMYHLTALYARSQPNLKPVFDNIRPTTNYGAQGLWRSAIVPGWGQMYKGSNLKGGIILGGTAACIGAIVFTECMRNSYNSKINTTHNANLKLSYANKRSNYATGRNICIGALGALYVYNIIDAIVAPGARRILTSPAKNYSWAPTITENAGIGLVASISF